MECQTLHRHIAQLQKRMIDNEKVKGLVPLSVATAIQLLERPEHPNIEFLSILCEYLIKV
jgi:hypothetical protein